MSFQDSAVIFFIALLLFGPKKLPELARQIGKLMGEFRRASNDFRMQMEDELRVSEQAERQKQIAAIEAAAPASAAELPAATMSVVNEPADATNAIEAHPHERLSGPAPTPEILSGTSQPEAQIPEHSIAQETTPEPTSDPTPAPPDRYRQEAEAIPPAAPLPIATSGDLNMMPPATGLPIGRTSSGVAQAFDSIPQAPSSAEAEVNSGTAHHG